MAVAVQTASSIFFNSVMRALKLSRTDCEQDNKTKGYAQEHAVGTFISWVEKDMMYIPVASIIIRVWN